MDKKMPRYFFDLSDNDKIFLDPEGSEAEHLELARDEAVRTLTEMAKDKLPEGSSPRKLIITIRDETRQPLESVSITFELKSLLGVPLESDRSECLP
jgi:hypothetical protein